MTILEVDSEGRYTMPITDLVELEPDSATLIKKVPSSFKPIQEGQI